MNELITRTTQLPDTLEDLTQFVLVGKSKLNAYMLKLRTVNRLTTAQEIRNQTLEETQELANALIAAEQRIGELLLAIPKATPNNNPFHENPDDGKLMKSKSETIKEMGYGKNEAADYQQMAKNPDIVRKVIEDATAAGEVVTKSAVMKQIQRAKEEARQEAQAEINRLKTADVGIRKTKRCRFMPTNDNTPDGPNELDMWMGDRGLVPVRVETGRQKAKATVKIRPEKLRKPLLEPTKQWTGETPEERFWRSAAEAMQKYRMKAPAERKRRDTCPKGRYTETEDAIIVNMRKKGVKIAQIAAATGRSVPAIKQRLSWLARNATSSNDASSGEEFVPNTGA